MARGVVCKSKNYLPKGILNVDYLHDPLHDSWSKPQIMGRLMTMPKEKGSQHLLDPSRDPFSWPVTLTTVREEYESP